MKCKPLICFAAITLLSGCALQKDYVALQGRITLLEEEIQESHSASKELKKDATRKGARLDSRFDTLEEEIQTLRGTLEESAFLAKRQKDGNEAALQSIEAIKKSLSDLSKRLIRLETYVGFEPSGIAPKTSPAEPSAQSLYSEAKKSFDSGAMEKARRSFENVVKEYPKSDIADNAQFWIGEIYYKEKWYQKAILEYLKVIENYPKGNKVPAAYLKQGLAFEALGEKDNALLILGELIRKFPDSPEANIARKKRDAN